MRLSKGVRAECSILKPSSLGVSQGMSRQSPCLSRGVEVLSRGSWHLCRAEYPLGRWPTGQMANEWVPSKKLQGPHEHMNQTKPTKRAKITKFDYRRTDENDENNDEQTDSHRTINILT